MFGGEKSRCVSGSRRDLRFQVETTQAMLKDTLCEISGGRYQQKYNSIHNYVFMCVISYLRTPELHISIFIRQTTTIAIGLTPSTKLKVKQ